jgi:hypothetical protein
VARSVAFTLASVRRTNQTCSFPASGFHEDVLVGDAIKGSIDQVHKPELIVERFGRQLFSAAAAPPVRKNAELEIRWR